MNSCSSGKGRLRLFLNDTALMAELAEQLDCLVMEFRRIWERREYRVNGKKS